MASVATSGCPKRSEGGCPCRSEEGAEPRANPAGVAVDSRWFCVRPVPSELGWERLSRFSLLRGSLHPHAMSQCVSECNPGESLA